MTKLCGVNYAGAGSCCLPDGHAGMHRYKCAGESCPGLPWPASQRAHPATCARLVGANLADIRERLEQLEREVHAIKFPLDGPAS